MNEPPYVPHDPPDEPPRHVRQPLLWRLAVCVYRDHVPVDPAAAETAAAGPAIEATTATAAVSVAAATCARCGELWPCRCRRLAERALVHAWR